MGLEKNKKELDICILNIYWVLALEYIVLTLIAIL